MERFTGVKKILVIKLRHIGDVLLTVPAIRALRDGLPGARISALVNSGTEEMLTGNPLLEEVFCFDRRIKESGSASRRIIGEIGFVRGLRQRNFDMTVDLTGGDRPALLGFLSGARYRLGYDPAGSGFAGKKRLYTHLAPRPQGRTHTVIRDCGIGAAFGIPPIDLTVDIFTSAQDEAAIDGLLKAAGIDATTKFVHVHPASRWLFKTWTIAGMASVLDGLQANGLRVVLTTGPSDAERKITISITEAMKTPPVDLSGRVSLKGLAALSRRAALFFGVDSAPMHIAAATGAPVVAVFGPSGAFDWGPWDNRQASVWINDREPDVNTPYPLKGGIQRFGRNTVIQKSWDCVPCGKDGCNGSKKSRCLDEITPEEVLKLLLENVSLPLPQDKM
ncbi:MAG: putative lipopolysaccharide heptosyltransferase III [Deltaproteobacteria bacterium RIFCSPLOWO2_02_FULL_53_8]|nr:MAG: putative lipopolysaccharide heptosyltransferase III [Deltaproteobacteria bacterium RIFCSPLOWO2_02_FULL_53_8]